MKNQSKAGLRARTTRLDRAKARLVVVDIQERLLPAIFEKERLVENSVRLIRGAAILHLPIVVTEQYRKALGPTDSRVAAAISEFAPMEKVTFSACGAAGFMAALQGVESCQALLCGMETHVCVSQTCFDLLDHGWTVFVVADAVSSRTADNYHVGLERMREAGAIIVSTEMALFELLERAGTEEFKQILELVR